MPPEEHIGISYYTTKDQVSVARLHYSADPEKNPRSPEGALWLDRTSSGWTGGIAGADWQQEYELNFEIEAGLKIFPSFDTTHYPHFTYDPSARDSPQIERHWPIWCGMDWGTVNPTVFTVHAMESATRVYQFDEVVCIGKAPSEVVEELRSKWYFEYIRGFVGDPSIWRSIPSDRAPQAGVRRMTSVGRMFQQAGVFIQRGANHVGVDADFITLLKDNLWRDKDSPVWKISRKCTWTISELRKIQWLENETEASRDKNDEPERIRSKGVDAFDANKYFCMSVNFESPKYADAPFDSFEYWAQKIEKEDILLNGNIFG